MAKVHVSNVVVLNNPCEFNTPFQFEITFECIEELKEDLEWKIIYVGSAESEAFDQVLDTVFVGPVPEGRHMFVFQADPPDTGKIPLADAVGVTVVLLTCSYRGKEFVRVGYYVNNEYSDPELRETPPPTPLYEKLTRNILATQPRVTRFKIEWDDKPAEGGGSGPFPEGEGGQGNAASGSSPASLPTESAMEESSMDQNSESNPPNLVESVPPPNPNGNSNGTVAIEYNDCNGEPINLIDPSAAAMMAKCTSNDSMNNTPMEVI